MATTEPLTGVTVQDQSDAATGGTQIGNLAMTLARFVVPRFTTTTARDTAYSGMVSGGGTMADGMLATVAGFLYRRINGTWRIDGDRAIPRSVTPTGGSVAANIPSGGAAETGATSGAAALANFTLYEARTVIVRADFRVNPGVAAQCSVKVDGVQVGIVPGVTRTDVTCTTGGVVALAAGSHAIALRVDALGGTVNWTNAQVNVAEHIAE